ncbi:MAG: hypothetical protein WA667_21865 [Candidatus Nitrosopolaris sp.]
MDTEAQSLYNELLEKHQVLQDSLYKTQEEKTRLEETLKYNTSKQRIIKIPYDVIYDMMKDKPTNILVCVDDNEKIKWVSQQV